MQLETAGGRQQFEETFGGGGRIRVIRAPGRVNLIGEHTDYNDGFVFPMAIEPDVRLICRGRSDGKIRIASSIFPGQIVEFSIQEKIQAGEPKWANYSKGIAAELIDAGIPLVGMDALITNTLPGGGGLSSSAALEVGTGLALLTLAGLEMDPGRLALLAQRAEHKYAGVPVGIMDQTIITAGKAGHAMLLDCRDLSKKFIPIDEKDLRIVVVNSMVKHELTGGEYAERRRQCEAGVKFFQQQCPAIRALRDVTINHIHAAEGKLDDVVFRRCRHVVTENVRTVQATSHLAQRHYEQFGELMVQSHESLRHDYEVSVPELDFLVEQGMSVRGVYGARMTGGGFGGCAVMLAQPRAVEPLRECLTSQYNKQFGKVPVMFVTTATAGVSVMG